MIPGGLGGDMMPGGQQPEPPEGFEKGKMPEGEWKQPPEGFEGGKMPGGFGGGRGQQDFETMMEVSEVFEIQGGGSYFSMVSVKE